jgi:hypothetical protein
MKIHVPIFLLLALTMSQLQGFDVVTIAAEGIVTNVVSKLSSWIFSPSKSEAEYAARDQQLKFRTKEEFLREFEFLKKTTRCTSDLILSQHELYRYQNFLAAIKEAFPEYADYIKKLFGQISQFYEGRVVRGFKIERRGCLGLRNIRGIRSYDYYEFYELIKQLAGDIMVEEIFMPAAQDISAEIHEAEAASRDIGTENSKKG